MTSVYVKEQGARIGRRGERLVVSKEGAVLKEFPLAQVDQVVLLGNVQLTTQATATLLERDIDVVFLSSYGKYRGRLAGAGSKRARLRQRQLQLLGDETFNLKLAQAIVEGKIHNQRILLQRQKRALEEQEGNSRLLAPANQRQFARALAGMMQMRRAAEQAKDVDSVRGYEGKAAAYYFEALRTVLGPEWRFRKREYYPPPDPFNALLSFAYSLLLKDVLAAVNVVGLDPYLGFFHEVSYGRPSLALDLMEEWRPAIADAMVMELVNRGVLKPESFSWTGRQNRPVELGEGGVEIVLQAYGQRLETELFHPQAGPGGRTSLRQAIVLQVRQLARVISGDMSDYAPLKGS